MRSINYWLGSFLLLCIAYILAVSANDDILSLATKFVQEQENTETISNDKWVASEPSNESPNGNFFNAVYSYVGRMTTYIVAGHVGTYDHDNRVHEIMLRIELQAKGFYPVYPISSMHCYVNWNDGSFSSSFSQTVVAYESNSTVYADFGYTKNGGSRIGTGEQVVICRYSTYDDYTVNATVTATMSTTDWTSSDDAVKEENTSNIIIKAPTKSSVNSPTSITDYKEHTFLKYKTTSFTSTDEFCFTQSVNVFPSYLKAYHDKDNILSIQLNDVRANSVDRFVASFVNTYLFASVSSAVHNAEIDCEVKSQQKGGHSSTTYSTVAKLLYTASIIHDSTTFFINPSLVFPSTAHNRQGLDLTITCSNINIIRAVTDNDVFKNAESATFLISTIRDGVSDEDIVGQYYCFGSRCSTSYISIGLFPYLVTLLVSGVFIFGFIAFCWYCCCYRRTIVVPVPVYVNATQPHYYGAPSYNQNFAPHPPHHGHHNNFGPAPGLAPRPAPGPGPSFAPRPAPGPGPSYAPAPGPSYAPAPGPSYAPAPGPGPSANRPLLGSGSLRSS